MSLSPLVRRFARVPPRFVRSRPVRRPRLERLEERQVPSLFPAVLDTSAPQVVQAMAAADLNADGLPDLALVGRDGPATGSDSPPAFVHVLLNVGGGSLTLGAETLAVPGQTLNADVFVGDFNGDGRADLGILSSDFGSSSFSAYLNSGFGPSGGPLAAPVTSDVSQTGVLALADFNRDNRTDLVVSASSPPGVPREPGIAIRLSNGDGTFAAPLELPFVAFRGVAAGDFNRDGVPDLAASSSQGVFTLLNDGNAGFTATPAVPPVAVGQVFLPLAVGDFNGDGAFDVAAAAEAGPAGLDIGNRVTVLLNAGNGALAPTGVFTPRLGEGGLELRAADFNGDGFADLAAATSGVPFMGQTVGRSAAAFLGTGAGAFAAPFPLPAQPSTSSTSATVALAAADFDGNGRGDVALAGDGVVRVALSASPSPALVQTPGLFDPATGTWYLRSASSAGAPDAGLFQYGLPGWLPVVGDWDGDGLDTVGVVDPATGTWYLRNSNTPGAPDAGLFQYGLPGWLPVVADWDGDGVTGIAAVDPATMTWYVQPSPGVLPMPFVYGLPGWVPVAGDWLGTGQAGIGVVDPTTLTWYLRTAATGAVPPDLPVFSYGGAGWTPVVGDWDGDGRATVGVTDPARTWYIHNANRPGTPDFAFVYGAPGWQPVAGTWPAQTTPLRAARGAPSSTAEELPRASRTRVLDTLFGLPW